MFACECVSEDNSKANYGLEDAASSHSNMSDIQLDEITRNVVYQHGGIRSYEGYLRSLGFHIKQRRTREKLALMRVDSRGIERHF